MMQKKKSDVPNVLLGRASTTGILEPSRDGKTPRGPQLGVPVLHLEDCGCPYISIFPEGLNLGVPVLHLEDCGYPYISIFAPVYTKGGKPAP
jgi:hypothetical protein